MLKEDEPGLTIGLIGGPNRICIVNIAATFDFEKMQKACCTAAYYLTKQFPNNQLFLEM
jgi:hypothetical protein